jgi:D,D-heptose 1,7-bisphosphate phosphatase
VAKNKAIFIDRDGTIAYDTHYCSNPADFFLLSSVPEAIKLLNDQNLMVIVITNQSGIARGYFTETTLKAIHQKMKNQLERKGAHIDGIYYCPHHPDDNCECRKPKTALFLRAAREFNIDMNNSYVIGDLDIDIEAGKSLNCKTVLVTTGPNGDRDITCFPDYVAENLLEAAQWIIKDLIR